MLFVVKEGSQEILFRIDAWDSDCEKKARGFIRNGGWVPVKDEITAMGDRVIWVA